MTSHLDKITIKTADEIELMRESGRLLAKVFTMLDDFIVPGVSTLEINDKVDDFIVNELYLPTLLDTLFLLICAQ